MNFISFIKQFKFIQTLIALRFLLSYCFFEWEFYNQYFLAKKILIQDKLEAFNFLLEFKPFVYIKKKVFYDYYNMNKSFEDLDHQSTFKQCKRGDPSSYISSYFDFLKEIWGFDRTGSQNVEVKEKLVVFLERSDFIKDLFFNDVYTNFIANNHFEFVKVWMSQILTESFEMLPYSMYKIFYFNRPNNMIEQELENFCLFADKSVSYIGFETDPILLFIAIFSLFISVYNLVLKNKDLKAKIEAFNYSIAGFSVLFFFIAEKFLAMLTYYELQLSFYALNFSYFTNIGVQLLRGILVCFIILSLIVVRQFIKFSKYTSVELYFLINISSFFSLIVISLTDIFAILIIFESFSFIILCFIVSESFNANVKAANQFFIYNTIITGISMLGIFGIFFVTKSLYLPLCGEIFQIIDEQANSKLNFFVFVVVSLWICSFLFKFGIFPFSAYIPVMYEATPLSLIFFINSTIKLSVFFVFLRLINEFVLINLIKDFISILSLVSFFLSAVLILTTTNLKRFLGLTTINLNSFLLVCLASNSAHVSIILILYLMLYNLAMFLVVSVFVTLDNMISRGYQIQFPELKHLLHNKKFLKFIVSFSLIFISGLPPLPLFILKYLILLEMYQANFYIFVLFIVLVNLLSFYYYLKVLQCIWVKEDFKDLQNLEMKNYFYAEKEQPFLKLVFLFFYLFIIILILFAIYLDDVFAFLEISLENITVNTYRQKNFETEADNVFFWIILMRKLSVCSINIVSIHRARNLLPEVANFFSKISTFINKKKFI